MTTSQVSRAHTGCWCEQGGGEIIVGRHEAGGWVSSLNGYDKHNSFLIPVLNTKQTFLVAGPGRTWTHSFGWPQCSDQSHNVDNSWADWCSMVWVLALHWVIMDKLSLGGSCSFMQTGIEMGARIKYNNKHKHNPLTFFFQPLSKSFIWMRD